MRRAARRDATEKDVVRAFRDAGFSVEFISGDGTPDLVIGKGPCMRWVEIKSGNKPLRDSQIAWAESWRGPTPLIVRSVDDAIAVIQGWASI